MPTGTESFVHRPRFARVAPPSFQLTERDIELVRLVARHRFLRSTQLSRLMEAPHKKICDRLTCLYHAGFLDRPRAQLDYHVRGGGSRPMVYGLSNRGAGLIADYKGRDQRQYDWAQKNRDAGRIFLSHTLAIADLRVALALAVRHRNDLSLLDGEELLSALPVETQKATNAFAWRVRVLNDGLADISVVPDYAFALRALDGKQRSYLVEVDQGTMPIERASLDQTSIIRKLLAYEAGRRERLHQKQFGWKNFRVLILTSSAERAKNISRAIKRTAVLKASPLFLINDYAVLTKADILAHEWCDPIGQLHLLGGANSRDIVEML